MNQARPSINSQPHPEAGSAIIYVFLGIILFVALALTFGRSLDTSQSSTAKNSGAIKASEISSYASDIQRAVDKLLLKGCSINDLNFYASHYTVASISANPSAPPDKSCDIFAPEGGKLTWKTCPDPQMCSDPYLYAYSIVGYTGVTGIGAQQSDLVLLVLVSKDTCEAINKSRGLPTTDLPGTTVGTSFYTGTFNYTSMLPWNGAGTYAPFEKTTSGCIYARNYMIAWGGEYYVYYHVLAAL